MDADSNAPDSVRPLAILVSGGLDSAVLLGEAARSGAPIHPLYIRQGLRWEAAELAHLDRFLHALRCSTLKPLWVMDLPVGDLYGAHWSVGGRNVPDARSPDAAVFLPGRNVLLLAKALLWCHLHGVGEVALGVLESNPFPDATPEFFAAFAGAVNRAVGGAVVVRTPFAGRTKAEVMERARGLPIELTFSCIRPAAGEHCGRCNKCAERRRAFRAAGLSDPTRYEAGDLCTA